MKYLSSAPFSIAVGSNVSERQYDIAVGRLVFCDQCKEHREPGHKCLFRLSFEWTDND